MIEDETDTRIQKWIHSCIQLQELNENWSTCSDPRGISSFLRRTRFMLYFKSMIITARVYEIPKEWFASRSLISDWQRQMAKIKG